MEQFTDNKGEIEIQIWSDRYDCEERRHLPDKCLEKKVVPCKIKNGWLVTDIPAGLHPPIGKFWVVVKKDGILHTTGDGHPRQCKEYVIINSIAISQERRRNEGQRDT